MKHPAKYSDAILKTLDKILPPDSAAILDPFGGTGKLRAIRPSCVLLEIEPEWAEMQGAIVGNALAMDFTDGSFDAVCTSPTYGNRMADQYLDHTKRHTYRSYLGRELSKDNSGSLQWGTRYRNFHVKAWAESYRVLRPGGMFVLNISDHIRDKKIVPVTQFHIDSLLTLGLQLQEHVVVQTPRQRHGTNYAARVDYESVVVFLK